MQSRGRDGWPESRRLRCLGASLLLAVILLAGAGALAAKTEWSQKGVTRRSEDLHRAVVALLADPSVQPSQETAFQDRELAAALATVRASEKVLSEMVKMLKDGYGKAPTQPLFDRVGDLFEDGGQLAKDSFIGVTAKMKVNHAREAYAQLVDYYD